MHHRRRGITLLSVIMTASIVAFDHEANAQTVNPTTAEFAASPDHNATSNGTPVLTRYDLQFYNAGAASPFQTVSLGKPTPDAAGVIRVLLTSVLSSLPSPGIVYEARVAAAGPGGVSLSTVSNTFSFTSPCNFSISPTTQMVAPGGGTGSVSVTAGAGCAWTAVSNAAWIAVTAGASGTGNGTVNYSVPADVTGSNRTGTLTVAGGTVTLSQTACSFAVSPTSVNLSSGGGAGTITVTATAGCPWTATSPASWLTITSGSAGAGPGSVAFSAAASSADRSATLTIAGRSVTVSQGGAPAPPSNVRILTSP